MKQRREKDLINYKSIWERWRMFWIGLAKKIERIKCWDEKVFRSVTNRIFLHHYVKNRSRWMELCGWDERLFILNDSKLATAADRPWKVLNLLDTSMGSFQVWVELRSHLLSEETFYHQEIAIILNDCFQISLRHLRLLQEICENLYQLKGFYSLKYYFNLQSISHM